MLLALLLLADPETVAGTGKPGYAGDGGPALAAQLHNPFDVLVDRDGHTLFTEQTSSTVRRIDGKTGVITTIAGTGKRGYTGDGGPATAATLNDPHGIEIDAENNVYVAERLNKCVRRIDAKTGVISTLAREGLKDPDGLCFDGEHTLYVADVQDQRVRAIDLHTGVMTTLVGSGKKETAGDDGPLAAASLNGPRALAHRDGVLYLVEREGHRVRRIDLKAGTIHAFAGTGKKGFTGDGGPASAATFNGPKEIDVDREGTVYVADTENNAIRRIDGKTGVITTVARGLGRPHGVFVTPGGSLLIGDTTRHRLARVTPSAAGRP